MAVKGVFTSDAGIVGERKGDFAGALLRREPNGSAPLLALTSGMESAGASDVMTVWFEENHISGRIDVTNNAGTGTSLVVNDASHTVPGVIYLVESTGELVLVTAVDDATGTLTVIRGFAETTIAAIDGSATPVPIQRIATAHEEASDRPVAVANLGYPRQNYMQIFRNTWDVSGTTREVSYWTGSKVAKNRGDGARLHAEDIERAFWFSKKSIGVKNGRPFRVMDGVESQITTNVTVASGGSVKYGELRDFLETVFMHRVQGKSNERIAFCGNSVLSVIDTLSMHWGTMRTLPGTTDFGLQVTKWITPFGTISLMTHPLMVESPFWTQNLYVLHPGAIRTRYLRRTSEDNYDRNGTRAGRDADFGVFTTECLLELHCEACHGMYTGIQTADISALE